MVIFNSYVCLSEGMISEMGYSNPEIQVDAVDA